MHRRILHRFLQTEARGAIVLLAAALVAIAWANLAPGTYLATWQLSLGPLTAGAFVGDVLMIAFFALIGLEIRRERVEGALRGRAIGLPGMMALGGMILPALIFLLIAAPAGYGSGWAIPIATDVAFAVGALMAVRSRVPAALWSLLLAVAVIDDLGAIVIIALAYGSHLDPWLLLGGAVALGALALVSRRCARWWPVVILGTLACALGAGGGIHAPVVGALCALALPAAWAEHPRGAISRIDAAIARLHGPVSFVVLPLFALTAAGIPPSLPSEAGALTLAVAVAVALPLGKALGIGLGGWLGMRLAPRPVGVRVHHLIGLGLLGGIGFTVSLLVSELAFSGPELAAAKLGVLLGSILAAAGGILILRRPAQSTPGPS